MNESTGQPTTAEELAIELTGFEILTLLGLETDGTGAEGTCHALHLPEVPAGSPLLSAGLSSLIVRRLAVPQEGEQQIVPQGRVLALAAILNQATEWIEATGGAEQRVNAAVLLRAPSGSALIEPKPYGIWQALPLPPGRPLAELAADYVRAAFGNHTARPFAGRLRALEPAGTTRRAVAVRIDEAGDWQISSGTADAMPDPVPVEADPSFGLLSKALAA